MIGIDGAFGEGGGQVLRTSLSLSMITGEPIRIDNIRAGRKKPGLMRQHLTAVRAAAELCGAEVEGDDIGSRAVEFKPGTVRAGEYSFAVGTAGSTTLILQTLLPALLRQRGKSSLRIEGGTHNMMAPPYDFFEQAFMPLVKAMGADISARLHRHGFFPAGGGKIEVEVEGGELRPISLGCRVGEPELKGVCLLSSLPTIVAERETLALARHLPELAGKCETRRVESPGPGNVLFVMAASACESGTAVTEVFTGFGEKNITSEQVGQATADEAMEYLLSEAAAGKHLADQLLLPLALAGGGEFTTLEPTLHTLTNIEIIQKFLPVRFTVKKHKDDLYTISC